MLVEAKDLVADINQWPVPTVLDVRWSLGQRDGYQKYSDGHIPGAIYADMNSGLSGPATAKAGRHPLPSAAKFQNVLQGWGVSFSRPVVVYDDHGSTSASRAWWLLRWAGHPDVSILNGGLRAWKAAGGDHAVGPGNLPRPGDFIVNPQPQMSVLDTDETKYWPQELQRRVLIDARSRNRYVGTHEPVDKRAGHIPGAINIPSVDLVGEEDRFKSPRELREIFLAAGITDACKVGVYCGSGIQATHTIAALEIAGLEGARLYPGSWSQWSADYARPIVTGELPR